MEDPGIHRLVECESASLAFWMVDLECMRPELWEHHQKWEESCKNVDSLCPLHMSLVVAGLMPLSRPSVHRYVLSGAKEHWNRLKEEVGLDLRLVDLPCRIYWDAVGPQPVRGLGAVVHPLEFVVAALSLPSSVVAPVWRFGFARLSFVGQLVLIFQIGHGIVLIIFVGIPC